MSLRFQKSGSNVHIYTLILPKGDEFSLSITTPFKIETGETHRLRQRWQKERPLKAARSVAMKIKNNVSRLLLTVEVQLEGNTKCLESEPAAESSSGTQEFRIVDKTRRTNEHVCQLLQHSLHRVMFQFEERWFSIRFGFLLRSDCPLLESNIHKFQNNIIMLSALNPDLILKHPLLPLPPQLTNSRFWHICIPKIIRFQAVRQQRMAGDHQSSRTVAHRGVAHR